MTKAAGLAVEMYGLGGAAADYDNDGLVDLYVTGLGRQPPVPQPRATASSPTSPPRPAWATAGFSHQRRSSSTTTRTGARPVRRQLREWSLDKDLFCTLDGKHKSYCTPESYKGQSRDPLPQQGRRDLRGRHAEGGPQEPGRQGPGRGRARLRRRRLARPLRGQRHPAQQALPATTATGPSRTWGWPRAWPSARPAWPARAWASTPADYERHGPAQPRGRQLLERDDRPSTTTRATGLFIDDAPASTVGQASLLTLSFAAFFFDYDLDGRLDIFAANGHVADDISPVQPKVTLRPAAPPLPQPRRAEVRGRGRPGWGPRFKRPMVGRGAPPTPTSTATATSTSCHGQQRSRGPAPERRRQPATPGCACGRSGTQSNRDGIGAKVTVTLAGGAQAAGAVVKTGSSYCSQSELPADLRPGRDGQGRQGRGGLAERPRRHRVGRRRQPDDHRPGRKGHRSRGQAGALTRGEASRSRGPTTVAVLRTA